MTDRLGKDHAYLLNSDKIRGQLGWVDTITLEEGLKSICGKTLIVETELKMCLFHKWSKWEEYKWIGVIYPGLIAPKEIRGKPLGVTQMWQKRSCQKCGYTQRKEVNSY